jgi:putative phosphoribosyl transferase
MRAAISALRLRSAAQITVGVPVGAAESCAEIAREADGLVCLAVPEPFVAVGRWYDDFRPVSDSEVRDLLGRAQRATAGRISAGDQGRP